jgi:hypothetical protein
VLRQPVNSFSKTGGTSRYNRQSIAAIHDQFRRSARRGHDHRSSARHRLHHGQSERLRLGRGVNDDVECAVNSGGVCLEGNEADAVLKAALGCGGTEFRLGELSGRPVDRTADDVPADRERW